MMSCKFYRIKRLILIIPVIIMTELCHGGIVRCEKYFVASQSGILSSRTNTTKLPQLGNHLGDVNLITTSNKAKLAEPNKDVLSRRKREDQSDPLEYSSDISEYEQDYEKDTFSDQNKDKSMDLSNAFKWFPRLGLYNKRASAMGLSNVDCQYTRENLRRLLETLVSARKAGDINGLIDLCGRRTRAGYLKTDIRFSGKKRNMFKTEMNDYY